MNKILKTSLIVASLLGVSTATLAANRDVCPTIAQIKNNEIGEWRLYHEGSESRANDQVYATFQQTVQSFKAASWKAKRHPQAHCAYNLDTKTIHVFLGKDAAKPEDTSAWKYVVPAADAICKNSNVEICAFGGGK
jgi:hypothetical protein